MAYGCVAAQPLNNTAFREIIPHKAHTALGVEALPVKAHNAGCFLPAMLQSVEAKGCDGCRFRVAKNTENATFFFQAIGIEIKQLIRHCSYSACD